MSEYKNKYLRVQEKTSKRVVLRMDVSHLSKRGRGREWDILDGQYPPSKYITCYETSQMELHVFMPAPVTSQSDVKQYKVEWFQEAKTTEG